MKKLLSKVLLSCIIASVAVCFVSCLDDKQSFPSIKTDFLVVETNSSGMLSKVRLDDGLSYDVTAQEIKFGVPDTLLRCVASYALTEQNIQLYSISHIFSSNPVPLEKFLEDGRYTEENLPRDPVNVISMWRSGGYINMQLGVLTTSVASHLYAFCKDGEGRYSLLHQRPANDMESYTQAVFLSMPVPEGVESLTFSVNTYEGTYARTF